MEIIYALANESNALVSWAATYDNFTVRGGDWHVTSLFTNDLMTFTPTSADWEIRSGVSEGNGGTLVDFGTAAQSSRRPGGSATP